jgi:F0F1-type ATP synthase gamma subunit
MTVKIFKKKIISLSQMKRVYNAIKLLSIIKMKQSMIFSKNNLRVIENIIDIGFFSSNIKVLTYNDKILQKPILKEIYKEYYEKVTILVYSPKKILFGDFFIKTIIETQSIFSTMVKFFQNNGVKYEINLYIVGVSESVSNTFLKILTRDVIFQDINITTNVISLQNIYSILSGVRNFAIMFFNKSKINYMTSLKFCQTFPSFLEKFCILKISNYYILERICVKNSNNIIKTFVEKKILDNINNNNKINDIYFIDNSKILYKNVDYLITELLINYTFYLSVLYESTERSHSADLAVKNIQNIIEKTKIELSCERQSKITNDLMSIISSMEIDR